MADGEATNKNAEVHPNAAPAPTPENNRDRPPNPLQRIVQRKRAIDARVQDMFQLTRATISGEASIADHAHQEEKQAFNPYAEMYDVRHSLQAMQMAWKPDLDALRQTLLTSGATLAQAEGWIEANRPLPAPTEIVQTTPETEPKTQKRGILNLFGLRKSDKKLEFENNTGNDAAIERARNERTAAELTEQMPILREMRDEVILKTISRVVDETITQQQTLREVFPDRDIMRILNGQLIRREFSEAFDELVSHHTFKQEEIDDYVVLLASQMSLGNGEQLDADQQQQLEEYRSRNINLLDDRERHVQVYYREPNRLFNPFINILVKEMTRQQVAEYVDSLKGLPINDAVKENLEAIKLSQENVVPYFRSREENPYDLDKEQDYLYAFARWQVLKNTPEIIEAFPMTVFNAAERAIIDRLFTSYVFPGGAESYLGSQAFRAINSLDSPYVLPYLFKQIKDHGAGYTTREALYSLTKVINQTDRRDVQAAIAGLPKADQRLISILRDEDSYLLRFFGDDNYRLCGVIQNVELAVVNETLAGILTRQHVDQNHIQAMYGQNMHDVTDMNHINAALLQERVLVEDTIISSKLGLWNVQYDKLLGSLTRDQADFTRLSERIVVEGLGVTDQQALDMLNQVMSHKHYAKSGFERSAFLQGLILLNSKEDGKEALETMLRAYKGTREDPRKIRRIFQTQQALEGMGSYGFVAPSAESILEVDHRIAQATEDLAKAPSRETRQPIEDTLDRLRVEHANLTGLKGIDDATTDRLVQVARGKLSLPDTYEDKIRSQLDILLKNGTIQIISILTGRYSENPELQQLMPLMTEITSHILDGDFREWRYSHAIAQEQLGVVTPEQREQWTRTTEPVAATVRLAGETAREESEIQAIGLILDQVRNHIRDKRKNFDFSPERGWKISAEIEHLTNQIQNTGSEAEIEVLEARKKSLSDEKQLIADLHVLDTLSPEKADQNDIAIRAHRIAEAAAHLGVPQAALDIDQVHQVFKLGDIISIQAYESDDLVTLLKVGVEPQETCQSWRRGQSNECLLSYVANGNVKVVNVADQNSSVITRSVMKVQKQRETSDTDSEGYPIMFLEPPYTLLSHPMIYRPYAKLVFQKAKEMNLPITLKTLDQGLNPIALQVFYEEAANYGYAVRLKAVDIYVQPNISPFEYSDSQGGRLTAFREYNSLSDTATFYLPEHEHLQPEIKDRSNSRPHVVKRRTVQRDQPRATNSPLPAGTN